MLVPRKAISELARLLEQGTRETVSFQQVRRPPDLRRRAAGRSPRSTVEGQFPAFEKVIAVSGDKTREPGARGAAERHPAGEPAVFRAQPRRRLALERGQARAAASSPDLGEARESLRRRLRGRAVSRSASTPNTSSSSWAWSGSEQVSLELKDGESQGMLRPASEDGGPTTATSSCRCGSRAARGALGLGRAARVRDVRNIREASRARPRAQRLRGPERTGKDVPARGGRAAGARALVPHRGHREH